METTTDSVRPTHTVQHLTRKNRSRPVFPRRSVSTPINEPKPRRPRYSHGSCREALCNCTAPLLSSNPRHLLNRASLSSTSRWIMTSTVSSARVSLQLLRSRGPARYVLPCPVRFPLMPLTFLAPGFAHLLLRDARWEWTLRVTAVSLPAKGNQITGVIYQHSMRSNSLCEIVLQRNIFFLIFVNKR